MDLAIRFPGVGRIHLESRFLFSEPQDPHCRQFLERVFQAREIIEVTIKSGDGTSEIPRTELGFCPRTYTLKHVVERVTESLNPRTARRNESSRHTNGTPNGSSVPNAHHCDDESGTKPELLARNGSSLHHAPSNLEPAGVTITSVTPVRRPEWGDSLLPLWNGGYALGD